MNPTFRWMGRSELLPRYIFAESLIVRRRVLELGAVASTQGESARFLLGRGARRVVACDADLAAVEQAQKASGTEDLRYRADVLEDLEQGGFDVVLVADLAPYVAQPARLAQLARCLDKGGYLLGALRNPAGLALAQTMDPEPRDPVPTYGQLLDALSPYFSSVQAATQSPLLGYQLAMGGGEGLDVDGSLVQGSEASYFVVLAGAEPLEDLDTTWVQLPPEPLAYTAGKLDESFQRTRAWEERSQKLKELLEEARAQVAGREAQVAELGVERERLREETVRLNEQLVAARRGPAEERERDEWAARLKRQDDELTALRARLEESEGLLAQARAEVEKLRRAQQEAQAQALATQELARQDRTRRQEVSAQLEEVRGKLAVSQEEARAAQERLAQVRAELERARADAARAAEAPPPTSEERELAKQREVSLAEQRSLALAESEALRAEIASLKDQLRAAEEQKVRDAQERARLERVSEADVAVAREAREALSRERAAFEEALAARDAEKRGMDTELAWARAEAQRLTTETRNLSEQTRAALENASRVAQQLMEAQALLRYSEQERGALRLAVEQARTAASGAPPPEPPQGWKVIEPGALDPLAAPKGSGEGSGG